MASSSKSKKSSSHGKSKSKSSKSKRKDDESVKELKHYDVFYTQPPPGLIQEERERPEDCIPDLPENRQAREFLAKAPTKGLWMPLGKEVKVMKCWRCKSYGHRTGDRECPMFITGNSQNEQFRNVHEDPMHEFIKENKKLDRDDRIRQLQALLDCTSSSSSSDSDSDSDESTDEHSKRKRKHRSRSPHKSKKRSKKKKQRKKQHKHRSSKH